MDAAEHRSSLSVRNRDLDLHQTGCVDDDAVDLVASATSVTS
jgi:hypothetical protein